MWSNPRIPFAMSSERPRYAPLRGKPLMINPVVAIEYWPSDQPMPRGVLPPPHGARIEPPDVANYSWVEYGLRCGRGQAWWQCPPRTKQRHPSLVSACSQCSCSV